MGTESMLKNSSRFILSLIILCAASASLHAAKIYKWVDEDGKTHYGDRTDSQAHNAQEVRIMKSQATDASITSRHQRTEQLLNSYQKERREKNERKQLAIEEKRDRQAKCLAAQNSKQKFERASSVYTVDEQGNRVFLSDEQRSSTISEADRAIAQWCSGAVVQWCS
ncbi:MAG: hypothetical protein ACI9BW_000149 [Gammaproteobacteria bacterium]|jgi:hypothetical protein